MVVRNYRSFLSYDYFDKLLRLENIVVFKIRRDSLHSWDHNLDIVSKTVYKYCIDYCLVYWGKTIYNIKINLAVSCSPIKLNEKVNYSLSIVIRNIYKNRTHILKYARRTFLMNTSYVLVFIFSTPNSHVSIYFICPINVNFQSKRPLKTIPMKFHCKLLR